MWAAGNNEVHKVYSKDIVVQNSKYYDPCDSSEMRVKWEATPGEGFAEFDVEEIFEFEPRNPPAVNLDWDDCNYEY